MKLGLAFDPGQYAYWQERITSTLCDLVPDLVTVDCSTREAFDRHAPEVIVGHESEALIACLQGPPTRLKWVQIMSAGLDRTLGVIGNAPVPFRITNVRGIHAEAMAEYLLAVLLYFEKRLGFFGECKAQKRWSRSSLGQLAGKRLLVCGAGGIGRRVGEVLAAVGVEAEAIARTPGPRAPFNRIHGLATLPGIVGEFDYVFCALPLTTATRGVFSREVIQAMRPGAIFVNIARGEMVDDQALIDALASGQLAGAALDAFRDEPLPPDSPLWDVPNLLITPHVSGRFGAGHELGLAVLRDNMSAYLSGAPLITEVFPERGY
ncbi:D-2-hydroxyacid dehydrogenase [Halomonas heilongjiangensis]|nr:D-2-hydroxyacid dehydrogenase [Halomonas heilongjiangensis]